IALYEFLFGKNPAASRQVVAAANTKEQAGIVFRMLKSQLMALRSVSKEVKKRTTVRRYDIESSDESTVKPLSSDADTLDGLDVLCGILDEYGEAKDTSIIEVLESSQAQQVEGLILMISTATKNL
ncbi:terminase large subunit, partial [Arthrospira platensis SPKY2]